VVAVGAAELLLVHPTGPGADAEQLRLEGDHLVQVLWPHRPQGGHDARFLPLSGAMSGVRRYSAWVGCSSPTAERARASRPTVAASTTRAARAGAGGSGSVVAGALSGGSVPAAGASACG